MLVLVARGRRVSFLPVRERIKGLLVHVGSRATAIRARDVQSCQSGWADGVLPLPATRTYQEGLPPETGIQGFQDITVLVSGRTREDTIYSSIS